MKLVLMVCFLAFSSLGHASDLQEIFEKIGVLKSDLSSQSYSRAELERISVALDRVIALAGAPSYQSPPLARPPQRAVSSNECMNAAYNYGLRDNTIVTACRNANAETPKCLAAGYNYGLRGETLALACPNANEETPKCFASAYNYGLRDQEILGGCSYGGGPNVFTAPCFATGYNYGLRKSVLSDLCAQISYDSTECVSTAYSNGLRQDQIVNACGENQRRRLRGRRY